MAVISQPRTQADATAAALPSRPIFMVLHHQAREGSMAANST